MPQPYPVIHVVANPVRGLLDRKRSEEHLPSSDESKRKTQTHKNDKESTVRLLPTTHNTNTCVKLTIVTHLSFSERIVIANLSYKP